MHKHVATLADFDGAKVGDDVESNAAKVGDAEYDYRNGRWCRSCASAWSVDFCEHFDKMSSW